VVLASAQWEKTNLRSIHLLVVDDDPDARRAVARLLEICGAEVVSAETVEEANHIIVGSRPFDAAIVDYQLVDKNCLSIISRLRSGNKPCCALMITGDPDETRGKEAIAAGADDFLIKPFIARELISAVAKTVQQTRQWRARLNTSYSVAPKDEPGAIREESDNAVGLPEYRACVEELSRRGNLSLRERQVLEQVMLGKKNRDAGAAIGCSERTVKYHMAKILKKIGVTSRNELIRLLFS
jgi:DNA-binding NarL/FixJ family response regulator